MSTSFSCDVCSKVFTNNSTLRRHGRTVHAEGEAAFSCACGKAFNRKDKFDCHQKTCETRPTTSTGVSSTTCDQCGKQFSNTQNLRRHMSTAHTLRKTSFTCTFCERGFHRKDKHIKHEESCEKEEACTLCKKRFKTLGALAAHLVEHACTSTQGTTAVNNTGLPNDIDLYVESALKGSVNNFSYRNIPEGETDLEETFKAYKDRLLAILQNCLREKGPIKHYIACKVRFVKANDESVKTTACFRSRVAVSLTGDEFNDQLENAFIEALHNCAQFMRLGSNWVIEQIETVDLNVVAYQPLAGSGYIDLSDSDKNNNMTPDDDSNWEGNTIDSDNESMDSNYW